nr:hypothetical protein [Brucella intermedia]
MIEVLVSKSLAKAIGAQRENQRHLDCLTRQIAARAGRQAITVKIRSRARRRSGHRLYHQELANRLTFERWRELDALTCRLVVQEQIIDDTSVAVLRLVCSSRDRRTSGGCGVASHHDAAQSLHGWQTLAISPSDCVYLISDPCRTALLVRCGLNRRPVVSRPLSRRVAADPTSLRKGRPAVPSRSKPAGPQTCPACSAGADL